MPKEKSPSDIIFSDFINEYISPLFKKAGFKKSVNNFFYADEKTRKKINFQLSSGCDSNTKIFYINVEVGFVELAEHLGKQLEERPKQIDVHSDGISSRIESLYPDLPSSFELNTNDDISEKGNYLASSMNTLISDLSEIKDLKSFRNHKWFIDKNVPTSVNILTYYLLGEVALAEEELSKLLEVFQERRVLSEKSHWLEKLRIEI